jgi:hypothetical protein
LARRKAFTDAWIPIQEEILGHLVDEGMPGEAQAWFKRNLETNTPGGKLNRGMSVVDTAEILKGGALDEVEYMKAAILGWCVELVRSAHIFARKLRVPISSKRTSWSRTTLWTAPSLAEGNPAGTGSWVLSAPSRGRFERSFTGGCREHRH